MANARGTVDLSLPETMASIRQAAAAQNWSLAEGQSAPTVFVFKKGMTLVSWGATYTVWFESVAPTETRVTIRAKETFALTDWGRGKRAIQQLLNTLGARECVTW